MSDSPAFQSFSRVVAPSKFSAKANEDVNDWLTKVDDYFDMLKLSSADQVRAARMLLDGLPAKLVVNLPPTPAGQDPWQSFKNLLRQRFQSRNTKFFARQKLYSLKQRGSVTKYNLQFDTLRSVLDDFGEVDAMLCYFMGLKSKIREHFAGNPNLRTDLQTIMNIAEVSTTNSIITSPVSSRLPSSPSIILNLITIPSLFLNLWIWMPCLDLVTMRRQSKSS